MPRGNRPKPSTKLISEEILKEIKSFRPLRIFINKQKRKGNVDNPFTLRVKFCQLPQDKQAKYLQKAVDKYIQLLDENDIDEHVQTECKLFDYLLMKGEQKKYFQSINAPTKPPGTAVPYYTQVMKQENDDDDSEPAWKSLSVNEKQNYKTMRKAAKAEYLAQVRNFSNDLPERLRTDYLLFVEQSPNKRQTIDTSYVNDHDDTITSTSIRQRRKSLTCLPDSLQPSVTTNDSQPKLNKVQLHTLHKCMPNTIYYETNVLDKDKPTFTKAMTKNAYMRSIFNQLDENEKLKYISKSIKKWNEFLESNANIIENQIATLHLLLYKNEDIILYFTSIGLPPRPPINSYLLFNHEKEEIGSQQSWTDLSQTQRNEYAQQLIELKNEYYEKLVEFVDQILPSDYMRYEFFRNVKYAIKDYELASKSEIIDKSTGRFKLIESHLQKMMKTNDINQFNQIKQRLLSTQLTNEQKHLVEELTQLLYKYIQ
ncbi:unnamed protein product [Rotaria sp. Silwood1]|nr:unnamed protein product [Rotaria sp. Silwood1]CAF1385792.1 unnamed protein product [Rotaria sp. Silwood1]CAF1387662.1 unnamed protein product [Rotaria sp. Silwood1]CAF3527354.1 unnamed protein product [Rotaria sp. Silwood1]CAF3556109.1 unnamed protein product [Rotaria sp. Silwood1]